MRCLHEAEASACIVIRVGIVWIWSISIRFFSIPSFDSNVINKVYQTYLFCLSLLQNIQLQLKTINKNQQAT